MTDPQFACAAEFVEVIDRAFTSMREDPVMGPTLQDADVPERFDFTDHALVLHVRPGEGAEPCLVWAWTDEVDWEPRVRMTMSSATANRYLQGRENVAMAIARRRIRVGGDVKAALTVLPLVKPLFPRYIEMLERDYPHLVV